MGLGAGSKLTRRGLTVGGVDRGQVEGEVADGPVAGRRAGGPRRLYDLQHHRLAVVAHGHLDAAQPLSRRRARHAAPVPRPERMNERMNE